MEKEKRLDWDRDDYLYWLMSREVEEKLRRSADRYITRYPHVSERYSYKPEENRLWTSAFYPGMMYLAYDLTGDMDFLKYQEDYLNSFEERLENGVHLTHDLGFLYTLSSVACFKLTGEERARQLALRAADCLAGRYNNKGRYIQAWGKMETGESEESKESEVRIIIDTMLNLPLLYWSGKEAYRRIAVEHAKTSARYLVRKDYTSYHTYWMNAGTGEAVRGATHQGFHDESTWARGEAWAVYGYALSYRYTREKLFLQTAMGTADVFIRNLPNDGVPYWDFSFNDRIPDLKDTSAVAIALCGLLELCNWVDEMKADTYRQVVFRVMRSLFDHYFDHDPDRAGILKEGMYHRDDGANEFTVWRDYFFFEALVRLQKDWKPYW